MQVLLFLDWEITLTINEIINLACVVVCVSSADMEYWYLYLLEYSFFSTQLYSVLCENYEYKYSYLLKY